MKAVIWSLFVMLIVASITFVSFEGGRLKEVIGRPISTTAVNGMATTSKKPLTDAEKIELLRTEAHKRGLQWKVFCTRWFEDMDEGYEGVAWPTGSMDDQTVNRWMETGATQADAAYSLYLSIQGAPTHPAEPPEAHKKRKKYICPLPDLRSGDKEAAE